MSAEIGFAEKEGGEMTELQRGRAHVSAEMSLLDETQKRQALLRFNGAALT